MSSGGGANLDEDMDDLSTANKQNTNDEKMADGALEEDNSEEELVLPPEVWASVMEFLPFETMLSCGATCRTILHDAMPLLKELRIDTSSQMNLKVASRFRDIKTIYINSLLKVTVEDEDDDGWTEINLDLESKVRVVHFLSKFDNLDKVVFVGKDENGDDIQYFTTVDAYFFEGEDQSYPNEGGRQSMLAFLDMISGGYNCGALSKPFKISGLCCPDATNRQGMRSDSCKTCIRACRSFPLESVAEFECRGSSKSKGKAGRMHGLDVCLERAILESIIESRPGGKELLRSKDRLLRLLGSGMRYKINSIDGEEDVHKPLYIVKYKQEELDEIKRVIEYAELDVKKLSMQSISNAIRQSFSINNGKIPPVDQCYISESSISYLTDLGLLIKKADFIRPLADLIEYAQQIVWVLNQCDSEINDEANEVQTTHHEDIQLDCLRLIGRFLLEIEDNPPINHIINVIPCLANWLPNGVDEYKVEAASALTNILARGTEDHRQKVIEAGVIEKFSGVIDSTNVSISKVAVLGLANIVSDGNEEQIKEVAEEALVKLIGLLDSDEDVCITSSLQILVAAKDYIKSRLGIHASLLCHIKRILNMKEPHHLDKLSKSSVLLRLVLEADNPPIQIALDLDLVSRVIELLKSTEDESIRLSLEHVMINLLDSTTKQVDDAFMNKQLDTLVKYEGLLPILVSLVESHDNTFAYKAISIVGKIAAMNDQYQNLLLQTDVVIPLLRVLQAPNATLATMEGTSSALSTCCRGRKLDNFSTSEEALAVLTKLLVSDHETVVNNSCWAVFHILDSLKYDCTEECDEMSNVMSIGFVKALLKLIPNAPHHVQEPVLKSLRLISSRGDACIKAISLRNGMSRLSKTLSSSHEKNQELATLTISNIISGNRDRLQTAIDNNISPYLFKMLTLEQNKKHALWALYQMTKTGSASQVKSLISEGCLDQLCALLTSDFDTISITLMALENIVKAYKDHVTPNCYCAIANDCYCAIANGLQVSLRVLKDQNRELKHGSERIEELSKKKAWLEFDEQNKRIDSLNRALSFLNEQLINNDKGLQLIAQKITVIGEDSPLGQVYVKTRAKEEEAREFLSDQLLATRTELSQALSELSQLYVKAEETAPFSWWKLEKRISFIFSWSDLPKRLKESNKELKEYTASVSSLKAFKADLNVDQMKGDIERLFDSVIGTSKNKNKKRKIGEVGVEVNSSK